MDFITLENKFKAVIDNKEDPGNFYTQVWSSVAYLTHEERMKTFSLSGQLKNKTPLALALHNITEGLIFIFTADFPRVFSCLLPAHKTFLELNDRGGIVASAALLSTCYRSTGQLDKSKSYIQVALENTEGLTQENVFGYFLAVTHYQAAEIDTQFKNYESAIDHYNHGMQFTNENLEQQGRFLNGLGVLFMALEKWEESISHLEKSLSIVSGQKNFLLESKILADIGKYYFKRKDFEKSFSFQERGLKMRLENNMQNPAITSYNQLAELCLAAGKPDEAVRYANAAVESAEKLKVFIKLYDAHLVLSKIYEEIKETEKAFYHYKKYHHYKDEVHSEEVMKKIEQLNSQHKIESVEKEKEIFRLRNVELKEAFDEIEKKNKELFRLSLVARETNNAIIILGSDGKLEWLNQMFNRFTGKTMQDLEQKGVTTIFQLSGNQNIRSVFDECIALKKSISYESRHIAADQREHWLINTLTPVMNSVGEITNFIIIASDITDRKIQEEIIKEKNKDITDSITYASRIQRALLTSEKYIERKLGGMNK